MTENEIRHIGTGGTVDSIWVPEMDTAAPAKTSTSAEYLDWMSGIGLDPVSHDTLFLKDSRETTLADRDLLSAKIAEASSKRILVTSGTFLMPDMAREARDHNMAEFYTKLGKRVVFAGALIPMKGYEMPDGGFNLGMGVALLKAESLPTEEPVLATMNGTVIAANQLRKDLTTATFAGATGTDDLLGYGRFTLIPAGGTIDFQEDGLDGLEPAVESVVPDYLRDNVRIRKLFEASKPILKDSRALTKGDMDTTVDIIRASDDEHVLITSGIIRMGELRDYIKRALHGNDKDRRIVLTGSRYILRRSGFTDAPFNLGFALGNLGLVKPGVHVALSGKVLGARKDPLKFIYTPAEREVLLARHSAEDQIR
jgi:L-asparaginase